MAEFKSIWIEETVAKSFETDFKERWKPTCFFQAMQEAATHHANHFGYGYRYMLDQEMIWIISRVKIQFHAFPVLGDKVIIRTWPKGIQQKLLFLRDFQFEDPAGKKFADVTSAWILLNPVTRKMVLPASLVGSIPDNNGISALKDTLEKINLPGNLPELFHIQVGYSAVDLMGHVNNARYIDWICDCFPLDNYASKSLDWLQINYNKEVKPGDKVSITAQPQDGVPDQWLIRGINQTTTSIAFDASVHWRE
jgi:medium-chain acyl-[acyl-carrier-protein] hydrolase